MPYQTWQELWASEHGEELAAKMKELDPTRTDIGARKTALGELIGELSEEERGAAWVKWEESRTGGLPVEKQVQYVYSHFREVASWLTVYIQK